MNLPINAPQAVASTSTTYVYGKKYEQDDEDYPTYDVYGFAKGTGVKSTTSYVTTPYVAPPPCHTGNVKIFEYKQDGATLVFFAGGTSHGSWQKPGQVLIALQGHDMGDVTPVKVMGMEMPELKKYDNRVINLDVTDNQPPKLPAKFWVDLIDGLCRVAYDEPNKTLEVLVRCMGGHGRTGTVMAVLAWFCDATNGEEPVAWLRKVYCNKVVESNSQFNYIELITGQKSLEVVHPFVPAVPLTPVTTNLPPLPSTSSSPSATVGTAATAKTEQTFAGLATKEAPYDKTWAEYKKLYLPHWPRTVCWSDEKTRWIYTYVNGVQRESILFPLINGLDIGDMIEDKRFDTVEYTVDSCILFMEDGTKITLVEEAPDELSLESVTWIDKGSCWSYKLLGVDSPLLLRVCPEVFCEVQTNGKWMGLGGPEFIQEIYYVNEDELEISLLNDTTVYVEKNQKGEIKTSVGTSFKSFYGTGV